MTTLLGNGAWADVRDVLEALAVVFIPAIGGAVGWFWKRLRRVEKSDAECQKERTVLKEQNNDQERRLSRTESKLSRVVDHVVRMDGLMRNTTTIQVDADGLVMVWDDKAVQMFGFTNDYMMGKSIGLIIPLQYREQYLDLLRSAATEKKIVRDRPIESEAVCRRGETFCVHILVNTWLAGGRWYGAGKFTRVVDGLLHDADGISAADWNSKIDSDPFKQGVRPTRVANAPPPTKAQ